jgi:DNA-binding MarR family transcriptional regulator
VAELNPHIGQLLRDSFRRFEEELRAGTAEARERYGVRPVHDSVLAYLDRDGTRASELADRAQLSRQAITQMVDELEALGVVERHPDPTDGRAKIVRYTPLALEHFDASRTVIADIEQRWGGLLGDGRYEDLRKMLSELLSSPGP